MESDGLIINIIMFILSAVALFVGSFILSFTSGLVAGYKTFSLSPLHIVGLTVIGSALFPFFGFTSTVILLILYGMLCLAGGLWERFS